MAAKPGVFCIAPEVVYVNDLGETKVDKTKPLSITLKKATPKFLGKNTSNNLIEENPTKTVDVALLPIEATLDWNTFEFKTQNTKKTFDFLIRSFIEDYMRQKMSSEKSGWRTLIEIITGAKISKFSLYGANRSKGRTLLELEGRGLG